MAEKPWLFNGVVGVISLLTGYVGAAVPWLYYDTTSSKLLSGLLFMAVTIAHERFLITRRH